MKLSTCAEIIYFILGFSLAFSFQLRTVHRIRTKIGKPINLTKKVEKWSSSHYMMSQDERDEPYTQRQLLKEETEAPFRQVRLFLYAGLTAAALVGGIVSFSELIAVLAGARRSIDMTQLYSNLAIDFGGVAVIGYFWRNDLKSQQSRLQRIQRGGALAGLKVRIQGESGPEVVKLSDLRRGRGIEKRVVIVAAPADLLKESIATSMRESENLLRNDLLLIPLQLDGATENDYRLSMPRLSTDDTDNSARHIGVPVSLVEWVNVLKNELSVAVSQQPEALVRGVTIIVKKNGKVGTRRFGVPLWESLVADVQSRSENGLDISNI